MRTDSPKTIFLKDYEAPAFFAEHCDLTFKIFDGHTLVTSKTTYHKNPNVQALMLHLNGEHQELVSIYLNDRKLDDQAYIKDDNGLRISVSEQSFILTIETKISPETNTALEGLYKSGDTYCTQCEAEGFRRITYYQDRPDNMATFTTRIEADKEKYPVLLSNGNLISEGDLDGGRHYTVWEDPWKKPCYLFALVAGNLVHIEDHYKTTSGRDVTLRIYVREGDEGQCRHAMESLKHSMRWDEETYGREYDLDLFNIVAVSDFNMGAMENKSLNIFNTALVLAHKDTATDADFMRVESVVGHEYFHNWTGNRITCRDWFQLSLKEGLTVFRDQEFSADMNSAPVQRIDDVMHLREFQFSEDASPLAHPIRPDNYIEINNFYTMTVYEKGAEVIRMFYNLLGPETYRKATDLYFERHDEQAVTCEDWAKCMEDASGMDLSQFKLWYTQAGTPEVKMTSQYDADAQRFTLRFEQKIPKTPGQDNKKPMHIPIRTALISGNGDEFTLNESGDKEIILHLKEPSQSFVFENITSKPTPSVLRGFSAPVKLTTDLTDNELRFLMVHDQDGFNKWESGQKLATRQIIAHYKNDGHVTDNAFIDSFKALCEKALEDGADHALMARALSLPSMGDLSQQLDNLDPVKLYEAQQRVQNDLAEATLDDMQRIYNALQNQSGEDKFHIAAGRRALKNVALSYICGFNDESKNAYGLAAAQYNYADNMTDRMGALACLVDSNADERQSCLDDFYDRFKAHELVVNKWFSLQACAVRPSIIDDVKTLAEHAEFNWKNPNRVRALFAAFAMRNMPAFHSADGDGYTFLTDAIIKLNDINPQIAARMLTPMREWRRFDKKRQGMIKACLERILAVEHLSKDVYEIASKSLKG
ncbi:MAG: aminopeptidase N [Alphaproteobacteria bacterium]|nr:aminopeptidase N [Alphaproteobacteria bacterium]